MKNAAWPAFSFTDLLRPADGWKTDHAILTTYSADLVVLVTALLSLTGCDLDHRRTGSRVELVKAIESLRGRVRILVQANRIAIPRNPRPILKLLDKFVHAITTDEHESSWHPEVTLVRYHRIEDSTDHQWRIWLGSRNLTRAMNWEAGLVLTSRADGRGQRIEGLDNLAGEFVERANLAALSRADVAAQFSKLTWECPPSCDMKKISLFIPDAAKRFPTLPSDTERVLVASTM